MTGVIDYGAGNLYSLSSSLKALGESAVVSSDVGTLEKCDRLILPGVGAFGAAMNKLSELRLDGFIKAYAASGGKLLGICLGMQLLFERSCEFGLTRGLGLIEGEIASLAGALSAAGIRLKIPAIGWNSLEIRRRDALTSGLGGGEFVYYVHSYYAPVGEYTSAFSDYGVPVTGIASSGNVFGCQFHPEKSGGTGLGLLKAFLNL
jgi:imidazole glycerol phosphate synthase, glutamine amidotransferase subunit